MKLRVDDERAKQIAMDAEPYRAGGAMFDYDGINDLLTDRATLLAEVERLRKAALRFGKHDSDCASHVRGQPCSCGFEEATRESSS